jgi:hypothetical protein
MESPRSATVFRSILTGLSHVYFLVGTSAFSFAVLLAFGSLSLASQVSLVPARPASIILRVAMGAVALVALGVAAALVASRNLARRQNWQRCCSAVAWFFFASLALTIFEQGGNTTRNSLDPRVAILYFVAIALVLTTIGILRNPRIRRLFGDSSAEPLLIRAPRRSPLRGRHLIWLMVGLTSGALLARLVQQLAIVLGLATAAVVVSLWAMRARRLSTWAFVLWFALAGYLVVYQQLWLDQ